MVKLMPSMAIGTFVNEEAIQLARARGMRNHQLWSPRSSARQIQRAGGIHVTLHDMTAQPRAEGERALEIHVIAGFEIAEIAALQRLGREIGGE